MPDLIKKFEDKEYNDILIIDSHMHLGKPPGFFSSANSDQSIIKSMDINNIRLGCISSYDSIGQNAVNGNRLIINLMNKYPGRFIGQFGVNPNFPEQVDIILNGVNKTDVFRQVKLHPGFHKYPINGNQYHKVYRLADSGSIPILMHTWGKNDIDMIDNLTQEYINTIFIIGHSGGTLDGIKAAIALSQKTNNTYLDLTLSFNYQGLIEWMVKEAGAERILFGSDSTFNSQSAALGKVVYADISDIDKLKILGQNMKNIISHSNNGGKNEHQ